MFGLMLALFLSSLDQTIVATALTSIATDLGGWEVMPWVVSAYLISSTVTTPIYGRLSDLYGRRPVLMVSVALFGFGAMLCALADSILLLIAARVVQGLGGGGLRSVALAVVGDILPPRERGRYQGYLSGVFGTANVIGPVLGGLFAEYLTWRWIFWIDLPLCALAFMLSYFQLRRLPLPGKKPRIDWLGALFILGSCTPLLLGITAVQRTGSWVSAEALACFGLGLAALAGLVVVERTAAEPMLPLRLFRVREAAIAYGISFVSSMMNIGLVILVPLSYQLLAGLSANESGLRMIAMTLGSVTGSFIGGQLVTRTGHYRFLPITGSVVAALSCLGIAWVGLGHSMAFDTVATLVLGLSFGCSFSPMTVCIQNALEPRDGGVGVACMLFFRLLGGAFGVAALSGLLIGQLTSGAAALPGIEALGENPGLKLLQASQRGTLSPELLAGMRTTLAAAFGTVFTVAGLGMALAAGLAMMLRGLPLRGR